MSKLSSILKLAVEAIGVPPRMIGYRHLPDVPLEAYCESEGLPYRVLHSPRTVKCPLPLSASSEQELPNNRGRYERSFADVPRLAVGATTVATVTNCRVISHRSRWGDDYYAIVTPDDRHLLTTGLALRSEHTPRLRQATSVRRIDKAVWITAHSVRNHYMWLYIHLPRVLVASQIANDSDILFPARDLLSDVKLGLLDRLGIAPLQFLDPSDDILEIDELTLVDTCTFNPELLGELRKRLTGDLATGERRRIYISREKCSIRRLANEPQLMSVLEPFGFEKVHFEDLTLDEQIETMHSAEVVVAPHGAGLANLLFCPTGTHVVEIQDPDDPNPHFYTLAALLGHNYWLVQGSVNPQEEPHVRDITAPISEISNILSTRLDLAANSSHAI